MVSHVDSAAQSPERLEAKPKGQSPSWPSNTSMLKIICVEEFLIVIIFD